MAPRSTVPLKVPVAPEVRIPPPTPRPMLPPTQRIPWQLVGNGKKTRVLEVKKNPAECAGRSLAVIARSPSVTFGEPSIPMVA